MAENVKTFVVCSSHKKLLSRMNDKQVADLFRSLFVYSEGEAVTNEDPLVDTVFMIMVDDMERMRAFREKKREAGQKGGKAGGHSDEADESKPKQNEANGSKGKQTEAEESKPKQEQPINIHGDTDVLSFKPPLTPKGDIPPAKKARVKYGTFQNVLLTEEEHDKLVEQFGYAGAEDMITRLDEYIASKGVKYKSHYATILAWKRKDGEQAQARQPYRAESLTEHNKAVAAQVCAELEAINSPF